MKSSVAKGFSEAQSDGYKRNRNGRICHVILQSYTDFSFFVGSPDREVRAVFAYIGIQKMKITMIIKV